MSFAHSAQAQDKAPPADGRTRLIGVADNTRIEQRGRLEGIFMQEIGTDQPALVLREGSVARESLLHFICARLEGLEQVAMTAEKVLEDVGQLRCNRRGIERQNPVDNMVRTRLVGWIEVARLGRGLEWAHNDPRRIGAQMQRLSVEECGF